MSHYFTNDESVKSEEMTIEVQFEDKKFKFVTDHGVFSREYLDYGTKVLLKQIIKHSSLDGKILDVGCGYGGLGLIVASYANSQLTMIDVNKRALSLCERNAKINKIDNIEIFESNIYDKVVDTYKTIITNPPIRAGKQVVHQIIIGSYDYLDEGGELFVVIKKQHGAKSALKALESKFSRVETLKKDKGYFIIKCNK